jgi:hypothetical protein
MSEVSVVRRRRSRAKAEALVAEFEASGLRREAFCRQRGLSVAAWISIVAVGRGACMLGADSAPG